MKCAVVVFHYRSPGKLYSQEYREPDNLFLEDPIQDEGATDMGGFAPKRRSQPSKTSPPRKRPRRQTSVEQSQPQARDRNPRLSIQRDYQEPRASQAGSQDDDADQTMPDADAPTPRQPKYPLRSAPSSDQRTNSLSPSPTPSAINTPGDLTPKMEEEQTELSQFLCLSGDPLASSSFFREVGFVRPNHSDTTELDLWATAVREEVTMGHGEVVLRSFLSDHSIKVDARDKFIRELRQYGSSKVSTQSQQTLNSNERETDLGRFLNGLPVPCPELEGIMHREVGLLPPDQNDTTELEHWSRLSCTVEGERLIRSVLTRRGVLLVQRDMLIYALKRHMPAADA